MVTMKAALTSLTQGQMGRVDSINAGKDATKRLFEMGLNTNACVQIVKNDSGPLVISINGNKVALGRGLAEKVILRKGEPDA